MRRETETGAHKKKFKEKLFSSEQNWKEKKTFSRRSSASITTFLLVSVSGYFWPAIGYDSAQKFSVSSPNWWTRKKRQAGTIQFRVHFFHFFASFLKIYIFAGFTAQMRKSKRNEKIHSGQSPFPQSQPAPMSKPLLFFRALNAVEYGSASC